MRKIYKYKLKITGEQILILPKESIILTIQCIGDIPYVWAQIDTIINETEERYILIFATGETLPDIEMEYIGTYQIFNGIEVHHIFEVLE